MKVSCPSCHSTLNIDDNKVPASGARIKCPSCKSVFPVKPASIVGAPAGATATTAPHPGASTSPAAAVPLPGASAGAATAVIPLPGAAAAPTVSAPAASRRDWQDEKTRAGVVPQSVRSPSHAVPLPGAPEDPAQAPIRAGERIPLPGAAGPTAVAPVTRGAVPLPGSATSPMPPPGRTNVLPAPDERERIHLGSGAMVPGDAATAPTSSSPRSIPLPGAAVASPTSSSPSGPRSIPLPGAVAPSPTSSSPSGPRSIPLPGAVAPSPTSSSPSGPRSIPLPGAAQVDQGTEAPRPDAQVDDAETAFPPFRDEPTDAPRGTAAFGLGSSDSLQFDISPPPTRAEAAAQAPAFDFVPPSKAPETSGEASELGSSGEAFDFDTSAEAPEDAFDVSPAPETPSPREHFEPAPTRSGFEPLPAAEPEGSFGAAPSMSFGEVDLAGGGGASDGGHDLEFDPTAEAPARTDDFEADLSSPLPPQPLAAEGPVDGLEMLSFIDDSAKEAGASRPDPNGTRRFHVKRRSGKVFGPFEEPVIIKMLEDGQLLGNEEVSLDAENWQPVGSEPAFQTVIAKLMEGPSASAAAPAPAPSVDEKARGPSMDRLKQIYEGRMAAVAVVQSKEPVPFKKRLPLIAAALAVALLVGAGVFLGVSTPYGFFGLKVLFPAKVRPDTREAGYLETAKKGLLAGTWRGYVTAKDAAGQALAIKEFPEARAVWSQAIFSLQRKFGKTRAEELSRAQAELGHIKLLGEKHPEVLKALAAEALARGATDEALSFLSDALARNSGDAEASFLRAEAYLQKKQVGQAKAEYEQLVQRTPTSARALHALGLVHKAQNEPSEATARFTAALEADPSHLTSAIELAELALLTEHDAAKGAALLARALDEKARATLSPADTAKALALEAETHVLKGQLDEAVPLFEAALKADAGNAFAQARLGRAYLALNDPERAAPLLQTATATSPESLDYAESYLTALIALGRMDEAQKAVQTATNRFPGNAMLAYLSGRVADALDNPKEAEAAYRRATAADPTLADAYLSLARLFMRFRRFNEAKPELEAGLEHAPRNTSLRVGLGELALHTRDLDRAEQELSATIEMDPNSAEAHLGLSRVAMERGKVDVARAEVNRALELNPHLPGVELQRGKVLWRAGELDEAVQALEAAQKAEPKNLQVRVTLGAVELDRGDLKRAREHLTATLALEPNHGDGNFYLARLEHAERRYAQAIDTMRRALDSNAQNPAYHFWMGRLLSDARKPDEALAEWQRALELDEGYADALEAMGRAYADRNELKKAVRSFQAALASDPSRTAVQVAIGDTQMKLDDWDGAIKSYRRALEMNPALAGLHAQLGLAWEEKHQLKKAVESYLKATETDPLNAEVWRRLGWVLKSQGKRKDALRAFQKYLDLRPEAEDKKQIEDEMYFLGGQ